MPVIEHFIEKQRLGEGFKAAAQTYFVPLAENIALHHKRAKSTFYVGINGCQGSGKSTLAAFLHDYLSETKQLNVVVLSLDDFYLSQAAREQLANTVHPLFKTRGVPGTHDISLMRKVLSDLSAQNVDLALPRFNKALDNPFAADYWPRIQSPVDIVIFEGWCWGVTAQHQRELVPPVNALEYNEDKDAVWRDYVNQQLARHYQPLYAYMQHWIMFQAPSFAEVFAWRAEQERKLATVTPCDQVSHVMDETQIARFIQFYQRLTEHALRTLPAHCHDVFVLNNRREILTHHRLNHVDNVSDG
jgi:D-glycerate 3-kinase